MNNFVQYIPIGFDPNGNPYYSEDIQKIMAAQNAKITPKKKYNIQLILIGVALIIGLVLYLTSVVKENHSDVMMSFDEMADLINLKA